MAGLRTRSPFVKAVSTLLVCRWRTWLALAAGLAIMAVTVATGYFDRERDTGIDWSHVAVYLCAVVVVALQADRLLRS